MHRKKGPGRKIMPPKCVVTALCIYYGSRTQKVCSYSWEGISFFNFCLLWMANGGGQEWDELENEKWSQFDRLIHAYSLSDFVMTVLLRMKECLKSVQLIWNSLLEGKFLPGYEGKLSRERDPNTRMEFPKIQPSVSREKKNLWDPLELTFTYMIILWNTKYNMCVKWKGNSQMLHVGTAIIYHS